MGLNPKLNRVMTVPEVAEYLKMSKSKVYYLVQHRMIPHFRIRRNVRIFESDLVGWIEKNKQQDK